MTRAQRIVAVLYCLLVVYCCVWIPWRVAMGPGREASTVEYSLVWAAPDTGIEAIPEMRLIFLRVVAITSVAGAAFLIAGKWKGISK